jgi:uncharacterized protein
MPDGTAPQASPGALHDIDAPWSYACGGCGSCCHGREFLVNPFDVGRLAHGLGLSAAQVIGRHVSPGRPALNTTGPRGACTFFKDGQGCTVHPHRPTVCRLFPLGRHITSARTVSFMESDPEPASRGTYGKAGTVRDYLAGQDALDDLEALDALGSLVDDALQMAWRAGVLADLDQAVGAALTGEGGPTPIQAFDAEMFVQHPADRPLLGRFKAHLHALRVHIGLDLAPAEHARLADTEEGRATLARMIVITAQLGASLGLQPGFSQGM